MKNWIIIISYLLVIASTQSLYIDQGAEFQINNIPSNFSKDTTIASITDVSFAVAWTHVHTNGSSAVYANILHSNGTTMTSGQFIVHQSRSGKEQRPKIISLSASNFIFTWFDNTILMLRVYSPSGSPISSDIQVSNVASLRMSVGVFSNSSFFIVWDASGIKGKSFNTQGTALGNEFTLINVNSAYNPFIIKNNQKFILVWETSNSEKQIQLNQDLSFAGPETVQFNKTQTGTVKIKDCFSLKTDRYLCIREETISLWTISIYNSTGNYTKSFQLSTKDISPLSNGTFVAMTTILNTYYGPSSYYEYMFARIYDSDAVELTGTEINVVDDRTTDRCRNARAISLSVTGIIFAYETNKSSISQSKKVNIKIYNAGICLQNQYYFYKNFSCNSYCLSPYFNRTTRGPYSYCDFICPYGGFYNPPTNRCVYQCNYPYINQNLQGYFICDYPCQPNYYYYFLNGSCLPDCPPSTNFLNGVQAFRPQNSSDRYFCIFSCYNIYHYFYSHNNTCHATCDLKRFNSINQSNYLYCVLPCNNKSDYFYLYNRTCLPTCPTQRGFTYQNVSGDLYCMFPCEKDKYYFHNNKTCSPTCETSLFMASNESNYLFCTFPCNLGDYYFSLNSSCSSSCASLPGFRIVNQSNNFYCNYACGNERYYYPANNSCSPRCSAPGFIANNRSRHLSCDFKCPLDEFYYELNGTCSSSCIESTLEFKQVNQSNHFYCAFVCPARQYYFSHNQSCSSNCPSPFNARNVSGYLYCDYTCNNNQYLHFTGDCTNTCDSPFSSILESGKFYCKYGCPEDQILNYDGSCSSTCIYPPNLRSQTIEFCQACDSDQTVCRFGTTIGPKSGFWIFNRTASMVSKCPFSAACLGNPLNSSNDSITSHGTCAEGYQGNLCASCKPGYGQLTNYQCLKCSGDANYYLQIILPLVLSIGLTAFSVHKLTGKKDQDFLEDKDTFQQSILIRILLNYLQINTMMKDIKIEWPGFLNDIYEFAQRFGSAGQGSVTSDCMLGFDSRVQLTRVKNILILISPGIFVGFLLIIWAIKFKKNRDKNAFKNLIITSIVVVVYNSIPTIFQSNLKFMDCRNIYDESNPIYFHTLNYDMQCWVSDHLAILLGIILPSLTIWMILAPLYLFFQLKRNKEKLQSLEMLQRYSFIYNGYKTKYFFWEFIVMIRKIMTICIIVFVQSSIVQIMLNLLILGIFIFIHTVHLPYENNRLNYLESYGYLTSLVMLLSALFFKYKELVPTTADLGLIYIIFMLFGGGSFMFLLIREFVSVVLSSLKKKKLLEKIPWKKKKLELESNEKFSLTLDSNLTSKTLLTKKSLKEKIQDVTDTNLMQSNVYDRDLTQNIINLDNNNDVFTTERLFYKTNEYSKRKINLHDSHTALPFLKDISDKVTNALYSPSGENLICVTEDKLIKIWDIKSLSCLMTLNGHEEEIYSINYSEDSKLIASGSQGAIKIWDTDSGQLLKTLFASNSSILCLAFSTNGKYLTSGSLDKSIKIWDVESGECLKTISKHKGEVTCLKFSPNSEYIASGSQDSTIKIWKIDTGVNVSSLEGHLGSVTCVDFSPIDKFLATASEDLTIRIWDPTTEECLHDLKGHSDYIYKITFSPDGKYLISGSSDNQIKVWDPIKGALVMEISKGEFEYNPKAILKQIEEKNAIETKSKTEKRSSNVKKKTIEYDMNKDVIPKKNLSPRKSNPFKSVVGEENKIADKKRIQGDKDDEHVQNGTSRVNSKRKSSQPPKSSKYY